MSEREKCKKKVTEKVESYSKEKFGKILCFDCQGNGKGKEEKPVNVNDIEKAPKKKGCTWKDKIPSEFIITLQGKEFITHQGLLFMAHKMGLKGITTELVTDADAETIVFKATVRMLIEGKDDDTYKIFTGYGDANKENVNEMVRKHKIRMAETRAVNRALRLSTNIGMTSIEELGGKE